MTSGAIPRAEQAEGGSRTSPHMPRSPSPEHWNISQMMEEGRNPIMEMILSLTLEIIYVLTGENRIVVKKRGEYVRPQLLLCGRMDDKKILEITNKIIELLTGEEEWEPVEGHEDLYQDAMMEDHHFPTARNPPASQMVPAGQRTGFVTGKHCSGPEKSKKKRASRAKHKKSARRQRASKAWPLPGEEQDLDPSNARTTEEAIAGNGVQSDSSADSTENSPDRAKETTWLEKPTLALDLPEDLPSPDVKEEELNSCDEDFTAAETDLDDTDQTSRVDKASDDFIKPQKTGPDRGGGWMADNSCTNSEVAPPPGSVRGEKTFPCSYCLKAFTSAMQLNLHVRSHRNPKALICSECGKCFSKKSELVTHHRVHTGEKPFACPECGKQFADRANVIAHQATHEQSASSSAEPLTRETLTRNDPALVVCLECGMSFKNKKVLTEHLKNHKQEKLYVCAVCGKGFTKRGHLSNHSRIHSGGKRNAFPGRGACAPQIRKRPFLCFECGKCFPSRSHLDRHQRIHTGEKPFSCSECDKRFTDRSGLVIHQRIHTGEKPYSCDDCGKCFRDRSGLVVHQRNHTGLHPYRCLECGKSFHNRARLERHERIHKEEQFYSCPECKQTFTSVTALTVHYQGHCAEQPSDRDEEEVASQLQPQGQLRYLKERRPVQHGESLTGDDSSSTEKPNVRRSPLDRTTLAREKGHRKEFSCSQCDKSFSDRASFIAHEQQQHSGEKPYKCPKCGECFVLKGYLTKHLETHQ